MMYVNNTPTTVLLIPNTNATKTKKVANRHLNI